MRVGQNIKTIAEAKRISIKELSRMVGIPYTTLYNMVNRNTDRFDLGLLEDIAHLTYPLEHYWNRESYP